MRYSQLQLFDETSVEPAQVVVEIPADRRLLWDRLWTLLLSPYETASVPSLGVSTQVQPDSSNPVGCGPSTRDAARGDSRATGPTARPRPRVPAGSS